MTEYEEQGYPEWIDLIESVYVNAESRVHRDFSSQSGVQGFVGMQVQAPIAEEWDGEPEEQGAYLRPEESEGMESAEYWIGYYSNKGMQK